MGLHLNWELRLPGTLSRDEVAAYVYDLHTHASSLGFDEMTPILHQIEPGNTETLPGYFWRWAEVIADPDPPLESRSIGDVTTGAGFGIHPARDARRQTSDSSIAQNPTAATLSGSGITAAKRNTRQ